MEKRSFFRRVSNAWPAIKWFVILGSLLASIEVSYEAEIWPGKDFELWTISKFFVHLCGLMGEALLIGCAFNVIFDGPERLDESLETLKQLGFLSDVRQAGISRFQLDPITLSHKQEIEYSPEFTLCIRGSDKFFTNAERYPLIIDRLRRKMSVKIYCHSDRIEDIVNFRKKLGKGDVPVEKFEIYKFPTNLLYNFLLVDKGIWVKTYFMNNHLMEYAAPAFFVERDHNVLFDRYLSDVKMIEAEASLVENEMEVSRAE